LKKSFDSISKRCPLASDDEAERKVGTQFVEFFPAKAQRRQENTMNSKSTCFLCVFAPLRDTCFQTATVPRTKRSVSLR